MPTSGESRARWDPFRHTQSAREVLPSSSVVSPAPHESPANAADAAVYVAVALHHHDMYRPRWRLRHLSTSRCWSSARKRSRTSSRPQRPSSSRWCRSERLPEETASCSRRSLRPHPLPSLPGLCARYVPGCGGRHDLSVSLTLSFSLNFCLSVSVSLSPSLSLSLSLSLSF